MQLKMMVDLFAGIGGFTLAGQQAGLTCLLASDHDPDCAQTYQANLTVPFVLAEINSRALLTQVLSLKPDLITAGFPCQPFSRAGRKQGFADPRGTGQLFFQLLDVVKQVRPAIILLENVAHLQRHDHGKTLGVMLDELAAAGYYPRYGILNARDICGLPQNRERLYIVAWRDRVLADNFQFPLATANFIPFGSILEESPDPHYYLHDGVVTRKIMSEPLDPGVIYTWRRYYLRRAPQAVCPTLLASMGQGGFNVPLIVDKGGLRQLSVRECARLQGLPESFVFPAEHREAISYQQIGNSISVPTVTRIIQAIQAGL